MALGLEIRLPFLDNDLVDFASKCPPSTKLQTSRVGREIDENNIVKKRVQSDVKGKVILRNTMADILPKNVIEMKKQGFSAPDATWFRSEIKRDEFEPFTKADSTLFSYLNFDVVNEIIDEHQAGKSNKRLFIWSTLYCWLWFKQHKKVQYAKSHTK